MTTSPKADAATAVLAAAEAVADVLPAGEPLTAVDDPSLGRPAPEATAVVATFTGSRSGSVLVVVDGELVAAMSTSPLGSLDLAAAVRPALEAAVATVGPAVMDDARSMTVQSAMDGGDVDLVALKTPQGQVAGWVGLRISNAAVSVPQQRTSVGSQGGLDLLHDVEMAVTVEIGRTRMCVRDLLQLAPGGVVELDRAAGAPADLLVNGRLIARGEVVVIDEDYGIRITEIVPGHGHGLGSADGRV